MTSDPMACAANGQTSDGRTYHYSSAHNGYIFDEDEKSDQAIDWLLAVRKYGLARANEMFPEG